jgi:zinc D-Ala-D-Ala carboxypeptidase
MDWGKYNPYFRPHEFRCRHCGIERMLPSFMDKLLAVRLEYGRPMIISSGYRCYDHPIEVAKNTRSGAHPLGCAGDVLVYGSYAVDLLEIGLRHGMTGIGVKQTGDVRMRFIHFDTMSRTGTPRAIWSYA